MTATCCLPLHFETATGERRVQHTCGARFGKPWQPVADAAERRRNGAA